MVFGRLEGHIHRGSGFEAVSKGQAFEKLT
jgi:hypothetical protein